MVLGRFFKLHGWRYLPGLVFLVANALLAVLPARILGEVIDSIATIDYWFTGTTQRVHKLVHHFALKQTGGELTVEGDPDHEAEDAIWVRFEDLDDVLSYPNERKIAWLYARKKNRQANE